MSGGKVHQCGTPEDIYERPATRFVAEFIGTANLMTGTYGTGITLPGGVPLHTGPLDGCAIGDEVSIAVRPEKVWLSDLTPDMVQTDGILKATVYAGATTTYLFEIAPALRFRCSNRITRRGRRSAGPTASASASAGAPTQPRTVGLNQEILQCLTTSSSRGRAGRPVAARDLVAGGADVLVLEARAIGSAVASSRSRSTTAASSSSVGR